jgi:hypothetical protein
MWKPICQPSNLVFMQEKGGPETGRRRAGDGPETGRRRAGDESHSGDMPRYRAVPSRIQPYPYRYRSLYIMFRHGSDPIRSDTKLIPFLPEWIRPDPIRYRSLYIISRHGSDPIRSDTGAYTPDPGMDPARPDPIPELIHPLLG